MLALISFLGRSTGQGPSRIAKRRTQDRPGGYIEDSLAETHASAIAQDWYIGTSPLVCDGDRKTDHGICTADRGQLRQLSICGSGL